MRISIKLLTITVLTALIYLLPMQYNELSAQRKDRNTGTRQTQNQRNNYLSIPGITENQKQKMSDYKIAYQKEIDVLREERKNTRSIKEKRAIDKKITTKSEKLNNNIRNLLTPDQYKFYTNNNKIENRKQENKKRGNGKGNGRGNGNGQKTGRRF